jgi:hypothetical protein
MRYCPFDLNGRHTASKDTEFHEGSRGHTIKKTYVHCTLSFNDEALANCLAAWLKAGTKLGRVDSRDVVVGIVMAHSGKPWNVTIRSERTQSYRATVDSTAGDNEAHCKKMLELFFSQITAEAKKADISFVTKRSGKLTYRR